MMTTIAAVFAYLIAGSLVWRAMRETAEWTWDGGPSRIEAAARNAVAAVRAGLDVSRLMWADLRPGDPRVPPKEAEGKNPVLIYASGRRDG